MRAISLLLCACSSALWAQTIMGGSGSKPGVRFRYETRIEPESPGQKLTGFGAGGIVVASNFHRYMLDTDSKKYFGYDLSIDPEPGGMFRVTFQPLSLSPAKLELNPAEWNQIPLPPMPAPQIVRNRDVIALDLFVHPATGQKIVDYLFIQDDRPGLRLPSGPPRDYTVDDVPIMLSKMRLSVNGKQIEQWDGSMSGAAVFFYLPGRGRQVFSLAPNAELGFHRAGEVRGSSLTIAWGGDTYQIECDGPIAPGGGVFHLYVYPDPSWRPRRNAGEFLLGASDARSLVRASRSAR